MKLFCKHEEIGIKRTGFGPVPIYEIARLKDWDYEMKDIYSVTCLKCGKEIERAQEK